MFGSRLLRSLAFASLSLAVLAGGAFAQARNIDIPATDLKSALDAYIRQAGVELVYKADDVNGLTSQAVRGSFTPEEALVRLLEGSDVTAQRGASGAFVVVRPAQNTPAAITEVVVVTGSRVIQDAANSPTPLTVMTTARLLATTPSTLSDALNKLPVFQGSATRRNAGGASANNGGDFLNLRNFGQQRTLVLLDNMRVPATNANGSVDISTLPQMLITRVDVVTGGASAVYGSDAITGVVNFVLDKTFEGVKYNFNTGVSDYGDGFSYQGGVAAGTRLFGGQGHVEGSLQYYKSEGVLKRNRPGGAQSWASYGLGTAASPITNIQQSRLNTHSFGGKITCTNCTVNGQQFVSSGVIGPFNTGIVPVANGVTGAISIGGDGVFVDWTSAIAAAKHAEAFARFSYNLGGNTVFWIQGTATEANVFNHFFPSQIDNGRQTTKYFKNNPFLSQAAMAQLGNNGLTDSTNIFNIQEWYDAPDRTRNTNSVTRNLVLSTGLSGQLGRYDWEVHYTHGESRDSVSGINNGNNQYHVAQQDAVLENGTIKCWNNTAAAIALHGDLYPGCIPINVFGNNVTSDAAYHYWSRTTNFAMTNIMDDISAAVSGELFDLPAGPVRAALSGEMRWLDYAVKSNASPTALINCTGLRLCGNPLTQTLWDNNTLASVAASQSVWEFSAETDIPLLADMPFVQTFDATLAGRYTDYSVSGAVQTWKIGLSWHVNDDVAFRGTTSIDIRAPTLNDLYAPITSTSVGYFDMLTNFAGTGTQQVTQGSPTLVPEVARTYTVGVVFTPAFIPGLTASVDFYNINLHNAIGSVAGINTQAQTLCNNSGGTSSFCELYRRPIAFGQPGFDTPANYPTAVLSRNLNASFQSTEGEDYEINYRFNLADIDNAWQGAVSLSALLNVAPKINGSAFPGAQITHTTNPKGHAAFFADYVIGAWAINGQIQWFSGLWKNGLLATPQIFAEPRVPSFSTVDLNIARKVQLENGAGMEMYFSVQNIGNANPPIVTGSSGNPGSGIPAPVGESVMGRYFTVGVRGNL